MRKLLIFLAVLLISSNSVFAAKIPDEIREYITKSVPNTDIRFDGVIIMPDNTIYLPLYPSLFSDVKKLAIKAYEACGCKGVSRVDFLVVEGVPYVLEINTSPGMTDLSDLPAQSAAMGIDYDNLVQLILNSAGLNK